jgi:hypothetical protein
MNTNKSVSLRQVAGSFVLCYLAELSKLYNSSARDVKNICSHVKTARRKLPSCNLSFLEIIIGDSLRPEVNAFPRSSCLDSTPSGRV